MNILKKLLSLLKTDEYMVIGCARINDRKDLFDLRLQDNPYVDRKLVVPIYVKKKDLER